MWAVQLEGSHDFLERLEANLQMPDLRCFSVGNRFYLMSKTFQNHKSSELVYNEAKKVISVIAGIAAINLNLWPSSVLQIVSVVELDDEMKVVKHHAYAVSDFTVQVRDALNSEDNVLNDLEKWVNLASVSGAVAKVFRLLRFGIDDYVNSYRVYEIINHDMGKNLRCLGVTDRESRRFTATANHPALSGDESRHGFIGGDPPKGEPMSPGDIERFIYRMVNRWIHHKLSMGILDE